MRSSKRLVALLLACGLMLATTPFHAAMAQDGFAGVTSRPVIFGVSAGVTRGPSTSAVSPGGIGYQFQASLESRPILRVLSLRADGVFADWGPDRMTALTANAVLMPIPRLPVAPYLMAGGGAYTGPGQGIEPGWTVGAGLRVRTSARMAISLESRVHVHRDARYNRIVPVPQALWGTQPYRYVWQPFSLGVRF